MKNMKKIISLALVFVMLFALSACQGSQTGTEDNVTLTWMLPFSEQPDEELIEAAVNEITQKELGVSVDLVCIDSSAFQERMNMNMASGKDFDICFTGYVNKYESAVYNGGLLELDELLEKVTPGLKETMPDYAWDVAKYNGKIYAVPNLQGYAPPTSVVFLEDVAQKYGFDTKSIKSIDDCEPYFEKIKQNEPNMIPFRLDYGAQHWFSPVWEQITNGIVIRKDGSSPKVEILYETQEYLHAVETLTRWYEMGILRSDLLSAQSEATEWKAGKFAAHGAGWLPGNEVTQTQMMGRPISIVPIEEPYMNKTLALAAMTGIGKNSKHPEQALKLIELVNTNNELLNLLALGIKDKHYTLNEEGKYTLIPNSGWTTSGAWLFGNNFNALLAAGQADDLWEETAQMNLDAVKSPLLGFTLNTDPIKNDISQVAAVSGEYGLGVLIVKKGEPYDEMLTKLREAGLDRIKEEVQRQVDEYWATK